MNLEVILLILVCGVATYTMRALPLLLSKQSRKPSHHTKEKPSISSVSSSNISQRKFSIDSEELLEYIPLCVFSILIFPPLLIKNSSLDFPLTNPEIYAAIFAAIIYKLTKNKLLPGVLAGATFLVITQIWF